MHHPRLGGVELLGPAVQMLFFVSVQVNPSVVPNCSNAYWPRDVRRVADGGHLVQELEGLSDLHASAYEQKCACDKAPTFVGR
jgi:hypothetical protein